MSWGQSVIYFMQEIHADGSEQGLIKIGVSRESRLGWRMAEVQDKIKKPLRILKYFPGTRADEQRLHAMFSFARVWPDREWFRSCPEIQAVIDSGTLPPVLPPTPPVFSDFLTEDSLTIPFFPKEGWVIEKIRTLAESQGRTIRAVIMDALITKVSCNTLAIARAELRKKKSAA